MSGGRAGSPRLGYLAGAVAVGSTLIALLVRVAVDPYLGNQLPYASFFIAVAVTAYLASPGATVLAVGLGYAAASYFFIPPRLSFWVESTADRAGTLAYFAVCASIALMSLLTSRARAKAEAREISARESAAEFQAFFRSPAIAAIQLTPEGGILDANERYCEITGYPREQLLQMNITDLSWPEDRPRELEAMASFLRSEVPLFQEEKRCRRSDGEAVWLAVTGAGVLGPDGRILRTVGLVQDISERKRAEAALRRERDFSTAVLDTAGALVVVLDRERRIMRFNHACETTTGYAAAEVEGRGLEFLIHPEDLPGVEEAWASLLGGAFPATHDNEWVAKDGTRRLISWANTAIPLAEGGVEYIIGTGVDITERSRAEAALRESEAALREADFRKNEFLGMLSHELRNPLAPIRNSLFVLDRVPAGGEQAQRAKAIIDRQVALLTRLVDDLLDMTRISRGKLQVERRPVELGVMLLRVVEDHRSLMAGLDLELDLGQKPLWVNGDPARLAQAVGNLLSNAAKFTEPGGHVRVTLEEEDAPARRALIRVRDDGAGISAELTRRLFLPFEQADRTLDRSRGGLGLGLALVKGLIEQHGGEVEVRSGGPGEGTEFVIRLPQEREASAVTAAPQGMAAGTKRRVLVIEDNVDAAESLCEALALGDHEVAVAYSGPEGLMKARSFEADVVLCDIGLPGMDGYAVARAMRADAGLRSVHLVALTGYARPQDLAMAKEAGFDQHLAKPPDLDRLEALLGSVPGRH